MGFNGLIKAKVANNIVIRKGANNPKSGANIIPPPTIAPIARETPPKGIIGGGIIGIAICLLSLLRPG